MPIWMLISDNLFVQSPLSGPSNKFYGRKLRKMTTTTIRSASFLRFLHFCDRSRRRRCRRPVGEHKTNKFRSKLRLSPSISAPTDRRLRLSGCRRRRRRRQVTHLDRCQPQSPTGDTARPEKKPDQFGDLLFQFPAPFNFAPA